MIQETLNQSTQPAEPTEEQSNLVLVDGLWINTETGEIASYDTEGIAEAKEPAGESAEPPEPTPEFVDWILARIQRRQVVANITERNLLDLQSQLADIERTWMERLPLENFEYAQLMEQHKRVSQLYNNAVIERNGIWRCFQSVLNRFAQARIKGKPRRWDSQKGFGTLNLHKKAATIEIADDFKAIALSRQLGVEIKVQEKPIHKELNSKIVAAYEFMAADKPFEEWTDEDKELYTVYNTVLANPGAVEFKPSVDELSLNLNGVKIK